MSGADELSALVDELFPEASALGLLSSEAMLGLLVGDGSELVERARAGHSPSARALANASDLVTAMALEAPAVEPSGALRTRVLASAARRRAGSPASTEQGARSASGPRTEPAPTAPKIQAPCERLAELHMALDADRARREQIEATGAAGVLGGVVEAAMDDAEIKTLLDRVAPFVEPGAVFVSIVRGGQTIHRVHRGFPAEFGNVDVVPRPISFCTHTISADRTFVVHDAASEPFFRSATLVTAFDCRTYLGVPLRVGGIGVGALCSIGWRPRRIRPSEVAFFELFARHAEAIVAKDAARRERLCGGGVYETGLFQELLGIEISRCADRAAGNAWLATEATGSAKRWMRETLGTPGLAILPAAARRRLAADDLAGWLPSGDIGVLVPAERLETAHVRLGAAASVATVSDTADAWIARARAIGR